MQHFAPVLTKIPIRHKSRPFQYVYQDALVRIMLGNISGKSTRKKLSANGHEFSRMRRKMHVATDEHGWTQIKKDEFGVAFAQIESN